MGNGWSGGGLKVGSTSTQEETNGQRPRRPFQEFNANVDTKTRHWSGIPYVQGKFIRLWEEIAKKERRTRGYGCLKLGKISAREIGEGARKTCESEWKKWMREEIWIHVQSLQRRKDGRIHVCRERREFQMVESRKRRK
ncbi:hypothetical protein SUGI_0274670 [Cryptomeria japonica]|nr:hypothetical protein SUGI_0274670 [Cryptomeria japonica]